LMKEKGRNSGKDRENKDNIKEIGKDRGML
jgi:hypothetical protein